MPFLLSVDFIKILGSSAFTNIFIGQFPKFIALHVSVSLYREGLNNVHPYLPLWYVAIKNGCKEYISLNFSATTPLENDLWTEPRDFGRNPFWDRVAIGNSPPTGIIPYNFVSKNPCGRTATWSNHHIKWNTFK